MAPPTAAVDARKSRRFISAFGLFSMFAVIVAHPISSLQFGGAMDSLADTQIGPAAADVGHRTVDIGVGRLRFFLEQVHCGHDLPRLAVSALGHVKFDPRQL